jgi:hypothetical protein
VTTRVPTPADVPRIAALVADGFDTYRSFAPSGWTPPPAEEHERYLAVRLWDPDTWATLAETDASLYTHRPGPCPGASTSAKAGASRAPRTTTTSASPSSSTGSI